jgi:hypothetical protein
MAHRYKSLGAGAVILILTFTGNPLGPARAEKNDDLIMAHLEFLGYTCDVVEHGIRARHSSKIHLLLSHAQGGILLQTGFPGNRSSGEEGARYAVLNTVNTRTRVARVFWTPDGNLFVSAWMPGSYEKARFAAFMEAWEQDGLALRDFSLELKPYLAQ